MTPASQARALAAFPLWVAMLWLAWIAPSPLHAADEAYYGRSILLSVPATPGDSLKAALAQLQSTLERITGQSFSIITDAANRADKSSSSNAASPAIVFATTDSPLVTDIMRKRFDGVTGEKAVLVRNSEDGNRLWIISPTQTGLEQGAFVFLEELGCRWFTSEKNWDIVPQKNDIRVKLDVLAKEGSTVWPAVEAERRDYSSKLTPMGRFGTERRRLMPSDLSPQIYVRGSVDMTLDARGNQTSITLKFRIQPPEAQVGAAAQGDDAPATPLVQLLTSEGKLVGESKTRADFEWEDVTFKIPRAGLYRIHLESAGLTGIQTPQRFSLALNHYRGQVLDAWKSRLYFFVPKGLARVALYTHSKQPITIYDPNGNPIKLPRADRLIAFDVPQGMDGKPWSFTDETSSRDIEMLNVPPYLSFFAEGLLIPDNTDRRRDK